MSKVPTPPITVYDDGDLEVFPDIKSTCRALEVYDVADLWISDRDGRTLRAVTQGYEITDLVVDEEFEPRPQLLADRLGQFIGRVGSKRVGISDVCGTPNDLLLAALLRFFTVGPQEPPAGHSRFKRNWRGR